MVLQALAGFVWNEGESFVSTARKAFAISNVCISPFALAYGIYWIILGFTRDAGAGAGSIIEGVLSFILGVTLIVNFMVTLRFKSVSDFHITCLMWCILPAVVGATFCIPEFGNRTLLLWYSIQCVVAQSSHAPYQSSVAFVVQMISCYNSAYGEVETPLYVPGARLNGPPLEVLGELMGSTVVGNSVLLAIYWQGKVYRETYNEAKSLAAARAAQELSIEVVQQLRRYDLEGVGATLAAYRDSDIDPQLLKNFAAMKTNLEHYRPHLPNYVFIEADRIDRDDDDRDHRHSVFALIPPGLGQGGPLVPSRSGDYGEGAGRAGGGDQNAMPTLTRTGDGDGEVARKSGSPPSQDLVEGFDTNSGVDPGDHSYLMGGGAHTPSEGNRTPEHGSLTGSNGILPTSVPTFAFGSRKITFALVDIHRVTRNHQERELRHLINTIYSIASETQASIHTFLGDVVQVTWNATARITQHELKATKFLGRLVREAANSNYSLAAAACSGPVRCYNIGSTNRQRALLVHNVWQGALRCCFNLASRYKTVLIDAPTHAVAHYDVDCRGCDILLSSGYEDKDEPSYELLFDKTTGGTTDRTVSGGTLNVRGVNNPEASFEQFPHPASISRSAGLTPTLPGQTEGQSTSPLVIGHDDGTQVASPTLDVDGGGGKEDIRSPSLGTVEQNNKRRTSVNNNPLSPLRSAHAHNSSKLSSSSFVYEVISDQFGKGGAKDSNWMYQARAAQMSPNATINSLLESIAAGQVGAALQRLHDLESGNPGEKLVARTPLVQRLIRHCEVVLAARVSETQSSAK